MRQTGKNNRQRGRNRRNGGGHINRNTTLDSNGPDVRLRGNAFQLYEKYVSLGNDASAAGERISAEAYYQHADHYFRVYSAVTAASEERRSQNGGAQNRDQSAASQTGQAQEQAQAAPAEQAAEAAEAEVTASADAGTDAEARESDAAAQ